MFKTQKLFLIAVVFSLVSVFNYADIFQSVKWNLMPSVFIPLSTSSDLYNTGSGFKVYTEIPYFTYFQTGINAGYNIMPTPAENDLTMTTIGLNSGFNYFLTSRLNMSLFADGGYYFATYNGIKEKNLYVGGNLRASYYLKPNFSITAEGGYYQFLTAADPRFEGIKISVGGTFSPRAGVDENIQIKDAEFNQLYPVFYKFYDDNPFGKISIENRENGRIENVKVSFFIKQYMSQPKVCGTFNSIPRNGIKEIPIVALFNEDILKITEATKVSADIIVEYDYISANFKKTRTETLRLHHRNAMTWDDDEKISAFITAKDPGLLRFSKYTAGLIRENGSKAVNLNFRLGMGMFEAIKIYGMNYVIDPTTPYTEFAGKSEKPDYLQFPTQTLSYKGGDCDDLTALYCAALESIGIETAFITIPGHIYAAFSIDMEPEKAKKYFKNSSNFIFKDNKTWVPVEITMFNENFMKAWQTGAREWRDNNNLESAKLYPTQVSWKKYEPVGMPGNEIRVPLPTSKDILAVYTKSLDGFIRDEIRITEKKLKAEISKSGFNAAKINKLGVLYARFGQYEKAEAEFRKVIKKKEYLPSLLNLGNIQLTKDKSAEAFKYFARAEKVSPSNSKVLLGLARSSFDTGDIKTANDNFKKLETANPKLAMDFPHLGSDSMAVGRASQVKNQEVTEWED
jgi:tetratricopeptide repeat protein